MDLSAKMKWLNQLVLIVHAHFFFESIFGLEDRLCLYGTYGRNANKIITLANGLEEARNRNLTLSLNLQWSSWYKTWFDVHENIETNFKGPCKSQLHAKFLYTRKPLNEHNSELSKLKPKKKYWKRAVRELKKNKKIAISVHRRWLEGECKIRAKAREYFCKTSADFSMVCTWTQSEIEKQWIYLSREDNFQTHASILLFSDHQQPKYDKTFKNSVKLNLQVEMCMMALSYAHFGSPMSSIDYVVAHWRTGLQFPVECFQQIHFQ